MSNDDVIRLISTNCVPVALNLYKIREAEGTAGDFFRSVVEQKPQYQGLWVVSPEGKVLAGHQETKDISDWYGRWPKLVLADVQAGLEAFGKITPRSLDRAGESRYQESLPDRGVGLRPDGSVRLAVYDRFVLVKDLEPQPPADSLGPTVLDSIQLNAEDWSTLAPATVEAGSQWTVPKSTAGQFFPLLSTNDTSFRDPKEVTSVQMIGHVRHVEGTSAYLAYEGHIAATHHRTANEGMVPNQCSGEAKMIGGLGVYDLKTGKMRSLTLVFDGLWRNYAPYDDPPGRFGAVVEWKCK